MTAVKVPGQYFRVPLPGKRAEVYRYTRSITTVSPSVLASIGYTPGGGSEVFEYCFSRESWTASTARAWVAAHNVNAPDSWGVYKMSRNGNISEAAWTSAYINDLPDSAFAFIESGGARNGEGKTVPRSKRHFPIKDADGKYDPAHVRNALARLSQSPFGRKAAPRVRAAARSLGIGRPAEPQEAKEALREAVLQEVWPFSDGGKPGVVNKDKGMIEGVMVMRSLGQGGRRYYSPEVMQKALALFEGRKVYVDHPKPGEDDDPRSVRDLIGQLRNVTVKEVDDGLAEMRGDLRVFPVQHFDLMALAEKAPDAVGNSINARGRVRKDKTGKFDEVVEEIRAVRSVDIVAEPGATSGLFENIDKTREEKVKQENKDMEELKQVQQDNARLLSEVDKATEEKDTALTKLAEYQEKEKVEQERAAKVKRAVQFLDEAKVDKKRRSETFLEALLRCPDDDSMRALIKDRFTEAKTGDGDGEGDGEGGGPSSDEEEVLGESNSAKVKSTKDSVLGALRG